MRIAQLPQHFLFSIAWSPEQEPLAPTQRAGGAAPPGSMAGLSSRAMARASSMPLPPLLQLNSDTTNSPTSSLNWADPSGLTAATHAAEGHLLRFKVRLRPFASALLPKQPEHCPVAINVATVPPAATSLALGGRAISSWVLAGQPGLRARQQRKPIQYGQLGFEHHFYHCGAP